MLTSGRSQFRTVLLDHGGRNEGQVSPGTLLLQGYVGPKDSLCTPSPLLGEARISLGASWVASPSVTEID